ncbi:DUF397 domain-containing protein [Streptomyces sp. NRRL WC-3626]|uniref:DUF397 domain-containing protein n=1 Tax=Streptomyces sp. NRRL WC-3626 TaxID=1463926 RepID=UPI000996F241|nr:DUF397 domain-containing protein [Streptomyces sp. NRRL WC-3626]
MATLSQLTWFKSSYSGGSGTECVECAQAVDGALIRDSKRTDGPMVHVTAEPWHVFIRSLTRGVQR